MNFKKIYFLILYTILGLVFSSCNNDVNESNNQETLEENFVISGAIRGASNLKLYLEALSSNGTINVAQGVTDAEGNFKIKGNIPGLGIYQFRVGESNTKIIPLTLVPKDKVKINSDFENFQIKPNVSGTEWSKTMNQYMAYFDIFLKGQMELNNQKNQLDENTFLLKYLELKKPIDGFALKNMLEHPENPFNIVLSNSATPNMGFKEWDPKNLEAIKKVANAFAKKYPNSPISQTLGQQATQIEMAYQDFLMNEKNTAGSNRIAPEIALKNPQGKIIKLSSLKGKIVLIDFWASWCGPCRKENPNVVRLFNAHKDKGFTVFSVSLDQDANAWKQAIASDGLIWTNHASDLMGWNTPMTKLYGFQSIPHTVLIDRDQKIVATGLRGPELEQKLLELIKK